MAVQALLRSALLEGGRAFVQALGFGSGSIAATAPRAVWAAVVPGAGVFLAGAAVGAGVALLVAPSSGEEIRKKLREQLDRVRQRAVSEVERSVESVQAQAEAAGVQGAELGPAVSSPQTERNVQALDAERAGGGGANGGSTRT